MSQSDNDNSNKVTEGIDWHRLMLRKDRPLPKRGCSWAFYIVLLLLIAYLVVSYIQYKNI